MPATTLPFIGAFVRYQLAPRYGIADSPIVSDDHSTFILLSLVYNL